MAAGTDRSPPVVTDRGPLVVAANRLPVRRNEETDEWEASPGGLVGALTPILQERDGTWVGWTGLPDHAPGRFDHDGIAQRPVGLTADEIEAHYRGFCNATIWPLYHNAIRSPEYHRSWWRPHVVVNRRFAEAVADSLDADGAAWIHDYHLQLVPALLREIAPRARIGFFLHIPFPPPELFAYLPWRRDILRGLLGADVLAFQTEQSVANFREAAERFAGARPVEGGLETDQRFVTVEVAPISIDVARFERIARSPEVERHAASIRRRLGPARKVLLGVDRLDYTKGIGVRLKALDTFFDRHPAIARECAVLQIAVPTRENIADYEDMKQEVERLVGQFNGKYGKAGYTPITYLYRALPIEELIGCYRAADVMMVTPLCDGMNLVAKEYAATRFDDTGVLVLSEFAGAAAELDRALLMNPYDADGFAEILARAAELPAADAKPRMAALRTRVAEIDVFGWSAGCIDALDRVAVMTPVAT